MCKTSYIRTNQNKKDAKKVNRAYPSSTPNLFLINNPSPLSRPMDLLKMEEKLDNEEYLRYSDFRNDFKLIVNNCRLYNGNNNGLSTTGSLILTKIPFYNPPPFPFRVHGNGEPTAGGV